MDNNKALRKEEIEALSAIYGDDLVIEGSEQKSISITLTHRLIPEKTIKLNVTLVDDYPLQKPPTYMFSAPWMSGGMKKNLSIALEKVINEHAGESVVYIMIEEAREYLDKDESQESTPQNSQEKPEAKTSHVESEQDELEENSKPLISHQNHHHYHKRGSNGNDSVPILYHGEPIIDRRSTFQAHLAVVNCVEQVEEVINTLKMNKKIASATHNIVAYRIPGGSHHSFIQDCDDDGETHAGGRLLHLLQLLDVKNVVVIVSRWYGGVNLGADRFKHINNAARELLCKCGHVNSNTESSNSEKTKRKSGKKEKLK